MPENNPVVIVGGGPNGLMTACELALAGVRPLVLEALPEPSTMPKANGLVGRVVQALDYRGLAEAFGSASPPRPTPVFQFGALWLDMAQLPGNTFFALPIPQLRMQELLTGRARDLGVEVRHGHEMVALRQYTDRVEIDVSGPEGEYVLTASYLVGADGGKSTVRKAAGIGFPGLTDRSSIGRNGEVAIDAPVAVGGGELDVPGLGRLRPGTFTRTENGLFAYGMFQPGRYRVAVQEWGDDARTPEQDDWTWQQIPVAELTAAVTRVLGVELPIREVDGGGARANTTSNSRLADRYRAGRVLLVGDAAHVQSGIGGPGLNLGLQDALNLGWKLAAAVQGWAPDGLLESYHAERHPVGERVIMSSRAQTALLRPGAHVTALRQVLQELLGSPDNVRHISELTSSADVRYDMGGAGDHDLIGRFLPDLPLGTSRVAEVLRDGRPRLLDLAGRADLVAVAEAWHDRVAVTVATSPDAPADAVLVRPDGHVAWAGADPVELEAALHTWFGAPALVAAGVS
ncbi:FAD-dependent monooxygenase [Pseudonocardia sp. GCM10023141]|uniref:FAD-dependent monooxygenase n=1 Tax=Pseudonocardia sp. GCM10023141 TaxID=3252653 RepID=UPI00360D8420